MTRCLIYINIYKWNFQHITRPTEKQMNHSRPLIYISSQYPASEKQSWATCLWSVARQKWKTLICIIAPWNTKSRSSSALVWLWVCASLGECVPVEGSVPVLQISPHPFALWSFSSQEATLTFFVEPVSHSAAFWSQNIKENCCCEIQNSCIVTLDRRLGQGIQQREPRSVCRCLCVHILSGNELCATTCGCACSFQ